MQKRQEIGSFVWWLINDKAVWEFYSPGNARTWVFLWVGELPLILFLRCSSLEYGLIYCPIQTSEERPALVLCSELLWFSRIYVKMFVERSKYCIQRIFSIVKIFVLVKNYAMYNQKLPFVSICFEWELPHSFYVWVIFWTSEEHSGDLSHVHHLMDDLPGLSIVGTNVCLGFLMLP